MGGAGDSVFAFYNLELLQPQKCLLLITSTVLAHKHDKCQDIKVEK